MTAAPTTEPTLSPTTASATKPAVGATEEFAAEATQDDDTATGQVEEPTIVPMETVAATEVPRTPLLMTVATTPLASLGSTRVAARKKNRDKWRDKVHYYRVPKSGSSALVEGPFRTKECKDRLVQHDN